MSSSQVLSDRQLREVTRLIADHHAAFMIRIGLGDLVPPEEVARLLRLGLVTKAQVRDLPTDAFTFGLLADALAEGEALDMDYADFKEWVRHHEPPITTEERAAIKHLKRSLGTHLKGLGNVVDKRTHQTLIEADQGLRRRLAAHVKRELVAGVEKRKSITEIVAGLRASTESSSRDWTRVAVTEVNNAFQEGKLATIQKANPGKDPWVFKRVHPDGCKDCVKAYTRKSGIPRLFRLSKLLAMGSNVHRKHADRTAVVGSHHPWCFPAGTLILTERGQVAIEDVRLTDCVLTHKGQWRQVTQLHQNQYTGPLVDVLGAFATPAHPFLTPRGWVPAEEIQESDHLFGVESYCALQQSGTTLLTYQDKPRKDFTGSVYNLSVWEDESYIANGIVAHNCGCVLNEMPPGFEFDANGGLVFAGFGK